MKIKVAKRKFVLTMLCIFSIFAMVAVSTPSHAIGKTLAGTSLCFLMPFAANIQGEGESATDFATRKGVAETPEAFVKRYLQFLDTEIKANKDNPELKGELKTLKATIKNLEDNAELITNLKAEVVKANLAIEAIKEGQDKKNILDIKGQLSTWREANKSALETIKGGGRSDLNRLTIKVASPMTPANTYNGSSYLPIPEISTTPNEIVRVQPTFWDYLPKGRSSSPNYIWINKKNPLGAAAFIGPGVAKPGISFEIATETSVAKKVAESIKVAKELLDDIDGMASWIQMEMAYQLRAKINTTLMTGVSSSTVPAGIQTISVPFSLTTISTTDPGNWDAIVACVAQLRSGNLQGNVTAFINPIDYANMKLHKAVSQGQLFTMIDAGATIVEDNNIPVGFIQIGILDYYKILIYEDFSITFGWENDDFTKNLVTAVGEMRIHQFSSENYTGAFIYDELADIKAAITTV